MQKSTVTLADIAKKLGTSVNTVSRALRDCSDISQETKERVRRMAEYMGYVPNQVASFLRSKRSNIISVFISSLTNPFFSVCVDYMLEYLLERQCRALISVKKGDMSVKVDDVVGCIQNGASGIISFLDITDDGAEYCEKNKIPFLLCGMRPKNSRVSAIYADDCQCGRLVGREAMAVQAKRPCYVENQSNNRDEPDAREIGFRDVLKESGCRYDVYRFDYYDRRESQERIRRDVLEHGNDFIFCYNDEMALIVLEAFSRDRNFNIPIFGVDRISEYLSYCRGIRSVGAKLSSIGRHSAQLILRNIEKYDGKTVREILPVELDNAGS